METYSIRNLKFTYPGGAKPALDGINLSFNKGELVVLCGKSGCGKTTLLRNLKTVLSPFGQRTGEIYFDGKLLESVDQREQAERIGYVLQNPDNQLVTDKVWHELAFGLENLGVDTKTIRIRVAEMASFFGIQTWFDKNVTELSGGQKQILNLAAVMVMQPDVLVLDEPTSQLDPIAAGEFLDTVRKVNREIGTTVIMTEHRLDEILPLANRAIVMDNGKIIVDDIPANVGAVLAQMEHHMFEGMPAPLQAYAMVYSKGYGRQLPCPVDVGEGRAWLTGLFDDTIPQFREIPAVEEPDHQGETPIVELSDVWYRYNRDDKDVVKGLSMKVYPGEIFCIVGGNGTGKTTALSLISGLRQPIRGKVRISLESWNQRKTKKRGEGMIGVLPQNAQAIFVEKTIGADLMEALEGKNLSQEERTQQVRQVAELVEIDHLMEAHPYDVSGGEQQRAALAKILLLNPKIILLDEPTKGIDNHFKNKLAEILRKCTENGATVIMVSHDIEFAGKYADRCAMFFDGAVSTTNAPRKFFSGNSFYTTASNRMSRHLFHNAVTPKDVAELCVANLSLKQGKPSNESPEAGQIRPTTPTTPPSPPTITAKPSNMEPSNTKLSNTESISTITKTKSFRWTVTTLLWICMPLTIYLGIRMPGESGYLVSSLLLIFYIMVPFFLGFEKRKPQAREVVLIAVMIALAVVSRAAFFMVPQFKPMLAIIIIAGVCLGAQSGFLVGSMSAFVSNFLFGQGPWTPFQMLAWGLIGFFAGVLVANLLKSKSPVALSIYGVFAVFLLHGGITDLWTLLGMTSTPTLAMALTVYGTGFLFNIILAAATVLFLLLLTRPMIEKIQRVQNKYGLLPYERRRQEEEANRSMKNQSMKNRKQTFRRLGTLLIAIFWVGLCIYLAWGTMAASSIPETMNKGELKWSLNFGTGYTNAPTPPIVHGDYVYVGVQNTLRKIDKETGLEVSRMELADSFGYATAALTYAEEVEGRNVIFAPLSEGRVQAVDADTMTSLWITEKMIGYSCLSRVVYDEGYIYYGTWKSDTLPGMFLCYSAKDFNPDMPTEDKTPTWKVEHAGGFYWSEASVDGSYVLFGSEDGSSGQSDATTRAEIYSCLKGEAFLKKQSASGASPVIDQEPIRGDIRSGVAYDAITNAYYFTSSTGTLHKKRLNLDGTFNRVEGTPESIELGGSTTGTPTLSQGKIYLGIQGPSKFGDAGHAIIIIDGESMTEEASAPTPGFVQSEMFLTQSMEEGGTLYLYMTYNQLPGGIYVMEIGEQAGKKVILSTGSNHYFTPPKSMQNYGISTLDVDEAGNLYYKNDSCNVMSIKKAIFK